MYGRLRHKFLHLHETTDLRRTLRAAHIPVAADRYCTFMILGTVLSLLGFIAINTYLSANRFEVTLFSVIPDLPARVILFMLMVPGLLFALYFYPSIVAAGRKTRIDFDLPHAVTYMQALSTTLTLYEVLRKVCEEAALFGEVSREFGTIVRDVEVFGDDLTTAMRSLIAITPSETFGDFLNDLISLSDSGGSVTAFLAARSDQFRENARQEMAMTLKTIEIMAEVYVTAFVAGPIALIIMLISQNLAGTGTLQYIMPLIYGGLPAGAIVMILLLYLLVPGDPLSISRQEVKEVEYGSEVSAAVDPSADTKFTKSIRSKKTYLRVLGVLRHPLRHYIADYTFSVAAGVLTTAILAYLFFIGPFQDFFGVYQMEATFCLLIIGFMIPVLVAYEGRRWYVSRVEAQIPGFLREVSDMKDIGMTLQGAIHRISRAKMGVLTSELCVVSFDIKRGSSLNTALVRMEERIGLVSVKRVISLVVRASQVTDNLREILTIAISDFEHYLKMKKERFNTTFTYVMIVYLSFGIFLYTAYELNGAFLSSFVALGGTSLNVSENLTDMFRISIILGTISGIMAGQFSANSILAGFKHAILFLLAAIWLFVYHIGA
ncbi:secretion system protein [Methanoculleus taiwanensis]|uniref:Secretion system protein n=1 Tax=Methanoculleus taiwanensis TaxID=1550565 RepID=A0A498H2U8_9EURY|nr:type II secretion system F family protein [Methanoculleus taiwanensis]RXE56585.1 secretion system protein [Methanoculleus taiwanensis]